MEGFGVIVFLVLICFAFMGFGALLDNSVESKTGPIEPKLEITIQNGVADTTWIYIEKPKK